MIVPAPRANALLLGHDEAEATLAEAMLSGRMHHAWLITGPSGIGKATLAFRFARRLLAGPPEGGSLALAETHPAFRRAAAGTHADLLTIQRKWDPKKKRMRGEIIVDDVRRVAEFLRRTPAEGGWRVVVIDGAEDLNRNAANALLKVLEEPPERAMLVLSCTAAGRLLPTIRSRCRRLRLGPLDDASLGTLIATYLPDLDAAQRARLVTLADGSPGRALQLADGEGVSYADMVADVMKSLPGLTPDQALLRAHALADVLGRQEDGFSTFMELLRAAIATSVRDSARAGPIAARPLDAWIDVWHALAHLQDQTENFYLDKRQALVNGLRLLVDAECIAN